MEINLKDLQVKGSERNYILKEIEALYTSKQERNLVKKENWRRYCFWCKVNKKPDTKENQELFRRNRSFIRERPIWSMLWHIKTKDLYTVLSVAKDKFNRNESVGAYLKSLAPK